MRFFYMQKLKSVQVDRLAHNNLCNCEQKSLLARTIRLLHSFIPTKKGTANAVPFGGTESRKNAHSIISDK